jgi:hypothetical protein
MFWHHSIAFGANSALQPTASVLPLIFCRSSRFVRDTEFCGGQVTSRLNFFLCRHKSRSIGKPYISTDKN